VVTAKMYFTCFFQVYNMFQDISPEDTEHSLSSEVEVTIIPDLEASTPSSPLFENPIYILDIADVRFMNGNIWWFNVESDNVHDVWSF